MKLRYVFVVLLVSLSNLSVRADELHDAIERIDVKRVQELLDQKEFTCHDEKKRLEKYAHSVAKHAKYTTKSVWRSNQDMAAVLGGAALMIGGPVASVVALYRSDEQPAVTFTRLGCMVASFCYGCRLQHKGRNHYAARAWHKKARRIESLIAKKHVHDHN